MCNDFHNQRISKFGVECARYEPSLYTQNTDMMDETVDNGAATAPALESVSTDEPVLDFYEILQIPKVATAKDITTAYKKQSLVYHPERNPGDENAAAKLELINQAYRVLNDPAKRALYDKGEPYDHVTSNTSEESSTIMGITKAITSMTTKLISKLPLINSEVPEDVAKVAKEICMYVKSISFIDRCIHRISV